MSEGHTEGNLNVVAIRRGWSRNFTLPPDEVAKMDYDMLESVLELNTLKLRTGRLRICVENPAGSGTYNLVRRWENDDSLYCVLVRNFFTERVNEGIVTTLDVRDELEEARAHEGAGGTFKADRAREWLKTRALNTRSGVGASSTMPSGAQTPADDRHLGGEAATPATQDETPSTAANGNGYFFGLFKGGSAAGTPPARPPKENGTDAAANADASQAAAPPSPPPSDTEKEEKEEDILRARGWKPMVRRLTRMRVPRKDGSTPEARPEADIMEEGDGEYIEYPDPLEMSADALATPNTPKKQRLFKRIPGADSPFLSPKKSKKDIKGKGKVPEVTIVKNPEDAMPAPVDDTPVPFPSSDAVSSSA